MKITPLRLLALEILDNNAQVHASEFAYQLVPRRKWWPQGAVRWGCGYMTPFLAEKLVHKRWGKNSFCITDKGRDVLASHKFGVEP